MWVKNSGLVWDQLLTSFTQTNVTEMRKQVREMNHKIPCERCKEDKKSSGKKNPVVLALDQLLTSLDCCRISRSDDCDHFELFQPLRSRSEYDPASPPTAPIVEQENRDNMGEYGSQ